MCQIQNKRESETSKERIESVLIFLHWSVLLYQLVVQRKCTYVCKCFLTAINCRRLFACVLFANLQYASIYCLKFNTDFFFNGSSMFTKEAISSLCWSLKMGEFMKHSHLSNTHRNRCFRFNKIYPISLKRKKIIHCSLFPQ